MKLLVVVCYATLRSMLVLLGGVDDVANTLNFKVFNEC